MAFHKASFHISTIWNHSIALLVLLVFIFLLIWLTKKMVFYSFEYSFSSPLVCWPLMKTVVLAYLFLTFLSLIFSILYTVIGLSSLKHFLLSFHSSRAFPVVSLPTASKVSPLSACPPRLPVVESLCTIQSSHYFSV